MKVLIQDTIRNLLLWNLYQAYTDYHGMMDLTENLYSHLAEDGSVAATKIVYNGIEMDLSQAV